MDAFQDALDKEAFYVAESEHRIIGILELTYRHIEFPSMLTRDVIYIDTMAVDENYRGMGIGHHFFEMLKNLKKEKHFDGIELQTLKMWLHMKCTKNMALQKNQSTWNYYK